MTCDFTHLDGSYVLGALAPAERLEFEQHLPDCDACSRSVRQLAGLPGLLSRVEPAVLEEPPVAPSVPDGLLPALLHAVRRTRRRRALVTAGLTAGLAAATVAVVAMGLGGRAGGEAPGAGPAATSSARTSSPARVMAPLGDVPVRARVALSSVAWGTRLDLTCTYARAGERYHLPPAVTYALVVRTRGGRTQQVGTWRALDGRTMRVTAATADAARDIDSVQVRTADGQPVLELTP
jgi:anti-sigma factor RsiW